MPLEPQNCFQRDPVRAPEFFLGFICNCLRGFRLSLVVPDIMFISLSKRAKMLVQRLKTMPLTPKTFFSSLMYTFLLSTSVNVIDWRSYSSTFIVTFMIGILAGSFNSSPLLIGFHSLFISFHAIHVFLS